MLIKNRQDAGILFEEASDGGAGAGNKEGEGAGGTPTLEQVQQRLAEAEKALKIANKEAKERREKLEAIDAAEKERKDKDLSELDQLRKKFEESERKTQELAQRQRESAIRHAVEMAATQNRFHDPQDAYRQADLSGIEVDDQGQVSGVDAAIKALVSKKPYLIKPEAGGSDINAAARGRATAPTIDEVVERKRKTDDMYIPF